LSVSSFYVASAADLANRVGGGNPLKTAQPPRQSGLFVRVAETLLGVGIGPGLWFTAPLCSELNVLRETANDHNFARGSATSY